VIIGGAVGAGVGSATCKAVGNEVGTPFSTDKFDDTEGVVGAEVSLVGAEVWVASVPVGALVGTPVPASERELVVLVGALVSIPVGSLVGI
jgi:hypothetical protein